MKVRVSVRGRFHGFDLARELAALGALERLVTSYPSCVARRFGIAARDVLSLPRHEVVARGVRRLPAAWAQRLEADVAASFARAAAHSLPRELDVLVAFSGQALEQIHGAHRAGAVAVLERGSTHIEIQRTLLEAAGESAGVRVRLPHPRVIERELAEYAAADRIAVPSAFAARSFVERGIPAEKLIVNPYGVDLVAFGPAQARPARPRFLAVGRVSVQKGSHVLVEAFQRAAIDGELVFAGPIEPELRPWARRVRGPRVRFLGALPGARLPALYQGATCLCLPSLQDGFGLVLLQAMASGLPVIASDHTGAAGLFDERDGVIVVSAGGVDTLAEQIARLAKDSDLASTLGERAAARARRGFSWADYGRRAVAAFDEALGERAALRPASATRSTWIPPHRRQRVA